MKAYLYGNISIKSDFIKENVQRKLQIDLTNLEYEYEIDRNTKVKESDLREGEKNQKYDFQKLKKYYKKEKYQL